MKMLHLLRHAKSSRTEDIDDHERPLSRRGRAAARRVGEHLPAKLGAVDLVLCSSARRTRETLDLVIGGFSPRPRIMIEEQLYLASAESLIKRLRRLAARDTSILLIGHNPGLHELAMALADKASPDFPALSSGKFPTAACVSFRVPAGWPALGSSRHELVAYVTPASLDGEEE
ncbi:MAG: histidine phosphatase family protein [Alphaproteobacteria bacterium]|nr:histidine phosphatase family protein [Alphaproteobacteria bacterium]